MSASRFYRGSSYVFNLIVWSRVAAGRQRRNAIELPPTILRRKGVHCRPPRLAVRRTDGSEGERFGAGFAEIYALLFANLQPPGILSRYYHARPGPAFHGVYLWDSAFIAQIWKCWEPAIAAEVLQSVIHLRDGKRLQHVVSEFTNSSFTQPPLVAWSAVALAPWLAPGPRREFFETIYQPLVDYQEWLSLHRQFPNGLYFWDHPYESGVENAPRFGSRHERDYRDTRRLAAPDLNAYIVLQLEALEQVAMALGRAAEARRFAEEAQSLRLRIESELWHEADGAYYDRDVDSGEWIRSRTIASLLPLWAGVPSVERAERLHAAAIHSADFGTLLPLPSVSIRDADFEKDMWRGPVWVNTAYGVLQGLLRYGFDASAGELAYRLAAGVYQVFAEESQVYEFYDPEAFHTRDLHRKRGNRWKAFTLGSGPQKDFVGWSGLVNTLVIEVLFGFRRSEDKVVLHPRFPAAAEGRTFTVTLPLDGLSIKLTRGSDGGCTGSLKRGEVIQSFSIDPGQSAIFPLLSEPLPCDTAT